MTTFTREDILEELTDYICCLENCFEDDSYEEWELEAVSRRINDLEIAKRVCEEFLY